MATEIATPHMGRVSIKGQLVIPAEIREALGIGPGTEVAFTVEGGRIVLRPITVKIVDDLRGSFAGGPSMADELQATRRAEDERWNEK